MTLHNDCAGGDCLACFPYGPYEPQDVLRRLRNEREKLDAEIKLVEDGIRKAAASWLSSRRKPSSASRGDWG